MPDKRTESWTPAHATKRPVALNAGVGWISVSRPVGVGRLLRLSRLKTQHLQPRRGFAIARRPVRRILSKRLHAWGDHPSRLTVTSQLLRSTRDYEPKFVGRAALSLYDLAPGGVCLAARVTPSAGALLPHRCTLTCSRLPPSSAV